MKSLWPQSLSSRLALILIAGMIAAQVLTGTIWYDTRYGNAMEMPARLLCTRVADALALLERFDAGRRPALLPSLDTGDFKITAINAPQAATPTFDANDQAIVALLREVVQQRARKPRELRVLAIALDPDEAGGNIVTLLRDESPPAHFVLQARLDDGSWYQIDAMEGQAGMNLTPVTAAFDYLLRIYVLRFAAIILISWFAVRLVLKPLQRLAAAAEQLGRNIHSPPLATDGPVEVSKAALAFNAMQRRLIANIAERTRFLAAVSHDLRSPITRMKLRTELLDGTISETQRQKFRNDLEEMDAMVSSTLNVMQSVDAGEPQQLVDIDSLLLSLQSDFGEMQAQVAIDGTAAPILGYARSLRRCLQNLVENAVRYGQLAHVVVTDTAAWLQIEVSDNGPGIAPELLEQVMEPYYRIEPSRNSATGGFGLGLSIAQMVAQAHQGTLRLRNGEAGGLIATLTLPRTAAAAQELAAAAG